MCLTRHVSLSSRPSSKLVWCVWFSVGTHSKMLPSSPADARTSPAHGQMLWIIASDRPTSWTPSDYVHCLRVFDER